MGVLMKPCVNAALTKLSEIISIMSKLNKYKVSNQPFFLGKEVFVDDSTAGIR